MKVRCSNCVHCVNKGMYCGLCNMKVDGDGCREVVGLVGMCEKFSPVINRNGECRRSTNIFRTAVLWFSLCFLMVSAINILYLTATADSFSLLDLRFEVILAFSIIAAGIYCIVNLMDN